MSVGEYRQTHLLPLQNFSVDKMEQILFKNDGLIGFVYHSQDPPLYIWTDIRCMGMNG